jgi:hypothetical protein
MLSNIANLEQCYKTFFTVEMYECAYQTGTLVPSKPFHSILLFEGKAKSLA